MNAALVDRKPSPPALKDPSLFRDRCYLDGAWVEADSGRRFDVDNPGDATVGFGEGTGDEMCFDFIGYYPNIPDRTLFGAVLLAVGAGVAEALGELGPQIEPPPGRAGAALHRQLGRPHPPNLRPPLRLSIRLGFYRVALGAVAPGQGGVAVYGEHRPLRLHLLRPARRGSFGVHRRSERGMQTRPRRLRYFGAVFVVHDGSSSSLGSSAAVAAAASVVGIAMTGCSVPGSASGVGLGCGSQRPTVEGCTSR